MLPTRLVFDTLGGKRDNFFLGEPTRQRSVLRGLICSAAPPRAAPPFPARGTYARVLGSTNLYRMPFVRASENNVHDSCLRCSWREGARFSPGRIDPSAFCPAPPCIDASLCRAALRHRAPNCPWYVRVLEFIGQSGTTTGLEIFV